jgi:hypothetical protein
MMANNRQPFLGGGTMKKAELLTVAVLAMSTLYLIIPPCTMADTIGIFNTGVDDSGTLLTANSTDPHYSLVTNPDIYTGANAFVIPNDYPIPPWISNGPNSNWIAPRSSYLHNLASGTYVYRTNFDLTGLDPLTAILTGSWMTDNNGLDILINGISTGFTTSFTQFQEGFASFSITSGFVGGLNSLDFVVFNGDSEANPTGLRVEVSGAANSVSVPEPMTMLLLGFGLIGLAGMRKRRKS